MSDIVKREENALTPMQMIAQCDDPQKLEMLMDLQERWQQNQARERFGHALAEFQGECRAIKKGKSYSVRGGKISYASIDDIMQVIQPLLTKHGLSVNYTVESDNGKDYVVCEVRHGAYKEIKRVPLVLPGNANNNAQNMGMALTYAKRYALCMALGLTITDEDTDARFVSQVVSPELADTIDNYLINLGDKVDREAFFKWAGCDSVFSIPAEKGEAALQMLKKKAGEA